MKVNRTSITYTEYPEKESAPKEYQELLKASEKMSSSAYAPYSEFLVGAAVLLEDGAVITGNNQENAAYPSGLCAERVALFYAKSTYPDKQIKAVAITARSENFVVTRPVTPCGACRQVIAEVESRQSIPVTIVMSGQVGPVYVIEGIQNLLPLQFMEDNLKRSKKK